MPSRARVLYELEYRIGSLSNMSERPLGASLYVGFLLDGGEPRNEEKFVSWVDLVEDFDALLEQVSTFLDEGDPTTGETSPSLPSTSRPSSPDTGET
jgi:hypothetical protein